MLLAQQPADVREEETTRGVVGIGVSLRVFVVDAMVASPMVGGILEGNRVEDDQNHSQGPLGLVGAMRPQTMGTGGNA